jgi:transposase InsO family protein
MNRDYEEHSKLDISEISKLLKDINKMSLQQGFAECKEYVEKYGLKSIADLRPALPKINQHEIRRQLVAMVIQLSEHHPGWGSTRLCKELKTMDIRISSTTISNILVKHQMGTKYERYLKLKAKYAEDLTNLSQEQLKIFMEFDSRFREPETRSSRPGELLVQDTIYIGYFKNIGEIYMQAIIDSYSNYAFGFLHIDIKPDFAVFILHNEVIPFFKKIQLPVKAILTDNGHEYCGKDNHHFELYLKLNNIEHLKNKARKNPNNIVRQFIDIATREFFNKINGSGDFENLEAFQSKYAQWLSYYNNERQYHGLPNMGKPPTLAIADYSAVRN